MGGVVYLARRVGRTPEEFGRRLKEERVSKNKMVRRSVRSHAGHLNQESPNVEPMADRVSLDESLLAVCRHYKP